MIERVNDFLDERGDAAREDLREAVEVREAERFPRNKDDIYSQRIWLRLDDVVAVVADLKNSTALSFRKHPQTSAKLYEAVTGNCAQIVAGFEADFVDIQGDGLFALFHGDGAYQRAICAGITLKSFSSGHLIPAIEEWEQAGDQFPKTGLKVGMHSGVLVVKKVGVRSRHRDWKEPVWAGRPVNWAFKCAQQADANELIATESVFRKFDHNDYLTHSCRCSTIPAQLWTDIEVEKLQQAREVRTKKLVVPWCKTCGNEFCQAILDGETDRDDVAVSGI